MNKTVIIYRTRKEEEPVIEWLESLRDIIIRERIESRVKRIINGNYGDHKRVQGILELRFHFGKGYRLYCGEDGNTIVVLLIGGDKSSQEKDIRTASECWEDYYEQKKV